MSFHTVLCKAFSSSHGFGQIVHWSAVMLVHWEKVMKGQWVTVME